MSDIFTWIYLVSTIFEKHLPLQESNLKYTLYIGKQQSFFNKEYIITLKTHYLFEDDFHYFN